MTTTADETAETTTEAASGTDTAEQPTTGTEIPPEGATPATGQDNGSETTTADDLASVPPARLAAMLREKRSAEQSVRQRLRDVEADRDRFADALTAYRQRSVHAAATDAGLLPEAVPDLDGHVDLDAVCADDGTVDDGKVCEALAELRKSRPHWFRPVAGTSGAEFTGGAGSASRQATWGELLTR